LVEDLRLDTDGLVGALPLGALHIDRAFAELKAQGAQFA